MKLSIIAFCLSALIFSSYAASATDKPPRWYTIETIFFEYTDPEAIHSEVWSDNPGTPDWESGESLKPVKNPEEIATSQTQLLIDENPFSPIENPLLFPTSRNENRLETQPINPHSAVIGATNITSEPAVIELPEAYQRLEDEHLTLSEHYQKLLDNPAYNPLFHLGWRQTALTKKQAKAVHVTPIEPIPPPVINESRLSAVPFDEFMEEENEVLPVTFISDEAEAETENPVLPNTDWVDTTDLSENDTWTHTIKRDDEEDTTTEDITEDTIYEDTETVQKIPPTTEQEEPTAEGLLTFYRSRYLHVMLDALLRHELPFDEQKARLDLVEEDEDSNWFDEEELTNKTFRLTEKRRIRTGKLHYFDHPLFGVLLIINRYEPVIPEGKAVSAVIPKLGNDGL
jgi:hypothetical protein